MEANRPLNLRIAFRDVVRTEAVEAAIRRHAEALLTFEPRIVSCDVAVEAPHRHKQHGRDYRVRIDLVIPGAEIVADKTSEHDGTQDVYSAIDHAFDHAVRRLRDRAEAMADRMRASQRE